MTYPFLIRGPTKASRVKMVKIDANGFRNALEKIFALFPVKYINFKFAKNMDLISAKQQAKKDSMDGATRYVVSHKDQECTVEMSEPGKAGDVLHAVFTKGKEIKEAVAAPSKPAKRVSERIMEEAEIIEAQEKINNKKQKPTMKTKKAVKKAAVKKAAKKTGAFVPPTPDASWGKKQGVAVKAMIVGNKKGIVYRDLRGVVITDKILKGRTNQDYVREVYVGKAA